MSGGNNPGFLNGWKEIANYLGRGVRTVQRWEEMGMPVRRPSKSSRSSVVTTPKI
jgi:phage terminase Nu1 subunit (DNA packaging protein)